MPATEKSAELPPVQDEKVVNLAVYKFKKSLMAEGFELVSDKYGKLTLVLRTPGRSRRPVL